MFCTYVVQYSALAELVNITEDGTVNIEDFRVFTKTHQALLYQVFHIQTKLKDNTLGWQLWEGISKRRIELRRGYNVQIANLMVLVSDVVWLVIVFVFVDAEHMCSIRKRLLNVVCAP